MSVKRFPEFRLGKVLATSFTATLTERCGEPVERIPVPERLVDWLAVNGLKVVSCSDSQLEHARQLREAVHEAATAVATQVPLLPQPSRSSTTAVRAARLRRSFRPGANRSGTWVPPPSRTPSA